MNDEFYSYGMNNDKNILKDKSFELALDIINLYKVLIEQKKEFVLSKQLLRSGTSVGANIREAQNAQSLSDFIHKLYIAQRECDESIYWLELLKQSTYLDENQVEGIRKKAASILKMLKSAILTTKQKLKIHNS